MNVIHLCPFLLGHRDETVSRRKQMLYRRVTNIRPTPIDLLRRGDTFGPKGKNVRVRIRKREPFCDRFEYVIADAASRQKNAGAVNCYDFQSVHEQNDRVLRGDKLKVKVSMIELKCLQAVSERDIDMILVEELQASESFRIWFATEVFNKASYKKKIGAWHSVSDPALGESDVVFLFVNETDGTSAILIENKISASAQPDQGIRYQKRGFAGLENGWWDEFKTCLVAPEKYLSSITQTETYDVEISYEQIQAYFAELQNQDERFAHKALVIEEGILQNRRGYQPEIDTSLTNFTEDYFAFASKNYPETGMVAPKPRPGGSTWIAFQPDYLPKGADIVHQTTAGFVKLFFRGAAEQFDELSKKYSAHLPDGADIKLAGKSVAIIKEVPKIADPQNRLFDEYRTEVKSALSAIKEILLAVKPSNTNKSASKE